MAVLEDVQTQEGSIFPMGMHWQSRERVSISVWKKGVKNCWIRFFDQRGLVKKYCMFPAQTGESEDVFTLCLQSPGLADELNGLEYDFYASGQTFTDPYACMTAGRERFGKKRAQVRGKVCTDEFDWTGENRTYIPLKQMIVYQCHVRGFTKHESSKVKHPGTFSGVTEKIPYLKELGINTLFMMPVYDFNEQMTDETGSLLNKINYWGYTRDAFYFSPKASYGSGNKPVVTEFKEMVCSLHSQGMNFILDMYFEGKSPEFITRCLRYYAQEYHVDGFHVTSDKMDLEWLRQDPVLAYCKIFGDGYQADSQGMYMEMNDGFMINARRFLKSDEGQTEGFYHYFKQQRQDGENLHYITQHNGFTLRDLISYDIKHNEKNGEKNRDGTQYNYSWNCGMEGYTRKKPVLAMRRKQDRNAWVMLLLGMAPPMILAGDEFGNSQKGNNNAY